MNVMLPSRVLFVIGSLGIGGAETQMHMLMRELIKRGVVCELFVLDGNGPLRPSIEESGVVVHDGGYDSRAPRWQKIFQLCCIVFRLQRLARRQRPDVLHAYLPLTNLMGALAGRLAGVPLVVTSRRALGTHQDRHAFWKPFDRLANALSHRVTANSQAVVEDTVARDGVERTKLRLIYNGIDHMRFASVTGARDVMRQTLGLRADDVGMVVVGNLIPYKGHADLIRALPQVVSRFPTLRCFFVGEDRGIGSSLTHLGKELSVIDAVVFLGRRDDVVEVMAGMDIFVMPSHEEGFSNALLEAMLSGLPVVATDVGGNREALENGQLGYLVPPKDTEALFGAISGYLADRSTAAQVGARARTTAMGKYSVGAMVDAHVRLYAEGRKTRALKS